MKLDAALRHTLADMQERITSQTTYRGVPAIKCPLDMWVYTELLWACRPTVIIEIGNWAGGTLLYLSDLMKSWPIATRFIGVDIDHSRLCEEICRHKITLIQSNAIDAIELVRRHITDQDVVFVIEDSSHEYAHTLEVLHLYGKLVTPGSYMICEDTICGHGLKVGPSPGPHEAVTEYLKTHPEFKPDNMRPFGITWNDNGVLKKHFRS